jgi:hypothetical protein
LLGEGGRRSLEMDRPIFGAVALIGAALLWGALPARAGETVIDVNMNATAKLPSGGGVKQVSGLEVSVGVDGNFTASGEVCKLIFEQGDRRTAVRVWENKDHRYFVSYANTHVVTGRTEAEIKGLKPGEWYFSIAAHKETFVECWRLSNEVTVEIE